MNKTKNYIRDINSIISEDIESIISAGLPWEIFKNKIILITGGGGFLAAYIVKSLLEINRAYQLGIKIICVARSMNGIRARLAPYMEDLNFSIYMHDISQPLPSDFPRADYIIHSASQASPKYYGVDPVGTLLANTAGTIYLLNHAVKCQTDRFLFFSSSEVYGIPVDSKEPVREIDYGYLDTMNVRSCYAESKRVGETMCAAWAQQFNLHTNVVRPFHTYGPGMALDDGRVFADFVGDVVAKRNIILKSDGLAQRSFCYIADATIGFLTVLLTGVKAQAYNVANPDAEISIRDLAILMAKLFPDRGVDTKFEVPVNENTYLKNPIIRTKPEISKIKELGWEPLTGLQDGFRRTVLSFLA